MLIHQNPKAPEPHAIGLGGNICDPYSTSWRIDGIGREPSCKRGGKPIYHPVLDHGQHPDHGDHQILARLVINPTWVAPVEKVLRVVPTDSDSGCRVDGNHDASLVQLPLPATRRAHKKNPNPMVVES